MGSYSCMCLCVCMHVHAHVSCVCAYMDVCIFYTVNISACEEVRSVGVPKPVMVFLIKSFKIVFILVPDLTQRNNNIC
jgi:hypothetical protein